MIVTRYFSIAFPALNFGLFGLRFRTSLAAISMACAMPLSAEEHFETCQEVFAKSDEMLAAAVDNRALLENQLFLMDNLSGTICDHDAIIGFFESRGYEIDKYRLELVQRRHRGTDQTALPFCMRHTSIWRRILFGGDCVSVANVSLFGDRVIAVKIFSPK